MTKISPDEAQISEAAYFIWLAEGKPEGRDEVHWQMAVEALSVPVKKPRKKAAPKKAATKTATKPASKTAAKTATKTAAKKTTTARKPRTTKAKAAPKAE
ncbi:DUF2934 domain-containing protein [Celeribacter halophilus]|uniref:DUF2934 domain-containing protein n=1 Tax=Celeribacter halophilus TaxID=576117 RepID=A0A1I3Q8H7_9RHOB|nr:DUF2934 domain-containing protein [Celeribacter halophilus]PZX14081.1 Protein of unknown function (DUF2934) [Celeribacter halophilus]SFJ29416.1 Protein of unknown function [Celeribacter halophilus]